MFGPNYYAFFYAKTLFLMLDDVDYLGVDKTKPHGAGKYEGRIDAAQLEFVRAVLAHTPPDALIVVVTHIPFATYLDPADPAQNLINREALFALFEGRRFTVSFAGHTHTTEHHYFDAADGWKGDGAASSSRADRAVGLMVERPLDHRGVAWADSRDGTPNGFHILSVDGNAYKTRFVPAKEPNGRQMRLSIDSRFHGAQREVERDFRLGQLFGSPIARASLGAASLVANVFDGGPKTKATMRIGDRPAVEMTRRATPRPVRSGTVRAQRGDKEGRGSRRRSPRTCGPRACPSTSPSGAHRVIVEAVTEYGDVVSGRLALEVTG